MRRDNDSKNESRSDSKNDSNRNGRRRSDGGRRRARPGPRGAAVVREATEASRGSAGRGPSHRQGNAPASAASRERIPVVGPEGTGDETTFAELGLVPELLQALETAGYEEPTPIQRQAVPPALAGRDLLGCAQTGTGKTAAFALPILQRLASLPRGGAKSSVRALVLAPTRELAAQIGVSFERYGRRTGLRSTVVFGGVSKRPQVSELRRGVDVLVATPGRLLDLLGDRALTLEDVRFLVLDEADRMLDMGFVHDVRRVVRAIRRERQTMLFSATLPDEIRELAEEVLDDPVRVAVAPVASTVEATDQVVYSVGKPEKLALLLTLLQDPSMERVLVFTRTKHGADKVAKKLTRAGVETAALHGNKSQGARERALDGFKRGRTRVIVATDIAARGLDVKGLSHVVNHDLPNEPETYVHRIGRTGRAGAVGVALSFCSPEERGFLSDIERLTRRPLERAQTPELIEVVLAPPPPRASGGRGDGAGRAPAAAKGDTRGAGRRRDRRGRTEGGKPAPAEATVAETGRPADGRARRRRPDAAEAPDRRKRRGEGPKKGGSSSRSAAADGDAKPWWQQARGAGGKRRRNRGVA